MAVHGKFTPLVARIFHVPSVVTDFSQVARRRLDFEDVVSGIDIFVFSTVQFNIIALDHMKNLKNIASYVAGLRRDESCSGLRRSCNQVCLHGYGLRADTSRQLNSLRANSLRDGAYLGLCYFVAGHFTCRARFCSLVGYTSKALQLVCGPTAPNKSSVPMTMLILGNSIVSRRFISAAVAVSVAFAMMVVIPTAGLSFATL